MSGIVVVEEEDDEKGEAAAEYFSKDFEWKELRAEVENDPSFAQHLLPTFEPTSSSSFPQSHSTDSDAWKRFHIRHSAGKFFKVPLFFQFLAHLIYLQRLNWAVW